MSLVFVLLLLPQRAGAFDLEKKVRSFTLDNGMKWLVIKRDQAPVISGIVMLKVGSADEQRGKTGVAHMFEHMAFKGSPLIGTSDFEKEGPVLKKIEDVGQRLTEEMQKKRPDKRIVEELGAEMKELAKEAEKHQVKNEVWEVLVRNGAANMNAYTSKDSTAFYASVPANRFELWARVTAQMIMEPVYREFYTEREVVAEERRTAIENDPDGAMMERILNASFVDGPYHWSTIGFEGEVEGLTIADARGFRNKYYVPSNMVGVVVGDISFGKAKRVIEKVFGKYPKAPVPEGPASPGIAKGGLLERFNFDAEPSVAVAFHKTTLPNPNEYTFDVIKSLLCNGRSSRLQKRIVFEKRMAKDIYCSDSFPGSRLDNLFLIWVEPVSPYAPGSIVKEVLAVVDELKRENVGADELERVRKSVTAGFVFSLEDNMNLAEMLATFEAIYGDWKLLVAYPAMIAAVDEQDVMRIAKEYFTPDNRIIVERYKSR